MKIYISGAITGLDIEVAKEKFKQGEVVVREMGFIPINPLDLAQQDENTTWLDYMRADIKVLVDCCGILMLDNWKDSKGAVVEYNLAKGLGLKIYHN